MGPLLIGVAALFVAALGTVIVFVTGLRAKASWVRRFNRAVGNPMQMKSAGTPEPAHR
jgi:hypothetical protein